MQSSTYRVQLAAKVLGLHKIDRVIQLGRTALVCQCCGEQVGNLHNSCQYPGSEMVRVKQAVVRR